MPPHTFTHYKMMSVLRYVFGLFTTELFDLISYIYVNLIKELAPHTTSGKYTKTDVLSARAQLLNARDGHADIA